MIFGMEQSRRDDYDTDASLEYSEEEMHQQFLDFYEDALPELKNAGRVVQFKVTTVKNHKIINIETINRMFNGMSCLNQGYYCLLKCFYL